MKLRRPRPKREADASSDRYFSSRPTPFTLQTWWTLMQYYKSQPAPRFSQGTQKWVKSLTATRDGRGLKGWREKIAMGLDATTYFHGIRHTFDIEKSSANWVIFYPSGDVFRGKCGGYFGGGYSNPPTVAACSVSNADLQARTRFYSNLRESQQSVAGLTFVGELGELLAQLRSPARTARALLGDYCHDLRNWRSRHRKASAAKAQQALSDTWLEYSFGLAPSIDDIRRIAGAMDDLLLEEPTEVIKGRGKDEKLVAETIYGLPPFSEKDPSGYLFVTHRVREVHKVTVKYIGCVKRSTYGPTDATGYLRRLGMDSFWEFVPTAWQLLPWSFFADMFSNIGDVIEASVTSTAGVQWSCKSTRYTLSKDVFTELDTERNDALYGKGKWLCDSTFFGRILCKRHENERIAQGASVPTLRFQLPGSSAQFLNLAALASSVAKLTPFK